MPVGGGPPPPVPPSSPFFQMASSSLKSFDLKVVFEILILNKSSRLAYIPALDVSEIMATPILIYPGP